MTRPATCRHTDRSHHAHGLCHQCYSSARRAKRRKRKRVREWTKKCAVCTRTFKAMRKAGLYCSEPCLRHAYRRRRSAKLGRTHESHEATCDAAMAERFVRALRDRGYRRVGLRAAHCNASRKGSYYTAKRVRHSQGALCAIRYWPPFEAEEKPA